MLRGRTNSLPWDEKRITIRFLTIWTSNKRNKYQEYYLPIHFLSFEFYDPRDEADSDCKVQIMTNQTEFSRVELGSHLNHSYASYLLCRYRKINKTHKFPSSLVFLWVRNRKWNRKLARPYKVVALGTFWHLLAVIRWKICFDL